MNTFELLEELSQKSRDEIQYAILALMIKGKINFTDVNNAYVKFLEYEREDNELKLADANSCTLSLLTGINKETNTNKPNIHWALHNLNESRQFNMQSLNEKFGYNKDEDCKFSFYWREKNGK